MRKALAVGLLLLAACAGKVPPGTGEYARCVAECCAPCTIECIPQVAEEVEPGTELVCCVKDTDECYEVTAPEAGK